MIAVQDGSPSDHFNAARAKNSRKLHHLMVSPRWFEHFFAKVPVLFEYLLPLTALPATLLHRLGIRLGTISSD